MRLHCAALLRGAASLPSLSLVATLHAAALRRGAFQRDVRARVARRTPRACCSTNCPHRICPAHGRCSACSADGRGRWMTRRAGMVGEGREVFRRMMRPALQHYASTVEMLGRAGEVEEAEGLMKPMEAPPRDRVMCVVLAAFRPRAHGRVNVAEREWPSRCMAMHA
ncbi:hypothetical protein VPH35_094926 [Triticum aestivum]